MRKQPDSSRYLDAVVVIFVCAAFLFLSPFLLVWSYPTAPWYLPYLIWAAVIVLAGIVQRLRYRHEL
ncbi:MAG: hypothetical protein R3337_04275 [Gammaproteobacteria bacterium]|nr:hypothetical protein [Gammaproteobacteria bacterium]